MAALTNPSFKKRSREGFDITRRDLCSLTGDRWLNDQVALAPSLSFLAPSPEPRASRPLPPASRPPPLTPHQVVQFYLALVAERSMSPAYREEGRPRVLAMSTFILQNLLKESRVSQLVIRG